MCTVAPYGSWASPVSPKMVAEGREKLKFPRCDVSRSPPFVTWMEERGTQDGHITVMGLALDSPSEGCPSAASAPIALTPLEHDVRSLVHGYGGLAYVVMDNHVLYVCADPTTPDAWSSQSIYAAPLPDSAGGYGPLGAAPKLIVAGAGRYRFVDLQCDVTHRRLLCVREEKTDAPYEIASIVGIRIRLDQGCATAAEEGVEVLVAGQDFYSYPLVSPDGTKMAWMAWDLPNMPWDSSRVWVAAVAADGALGAPRVVAGGDQIACMQPLWSPDSTLYVVCDTTDWWNVYRMEGDGALRAIAPMEAEFAAPHWYHGMSQLAFTAPTRLYCTYKKDMCSHFACIDTASGAVTAIPTPYQHIYALATTGSGVCFLASAPDIPPALVHYDEATGLLSTVRCPHSACSAYASKAVARTFPSSRGDGSVVHALLHPPSNPSFTAPHSTAPPLLVNVHGGPTDQADPRYREELSVWTSRGFAVLAVNHVGSSGYGRAYRTRLYGQWGVAEVQDCIDAARALAAAGEVDGARMAIRGGSAGGYTTLAAVTASDGVFGAGASYYGVADLAMLIKETHKFESRYVQLLVGDDATVLAQRSPIHNLDRLRCPVILFQGTQDTIVPPSQAREVAAALAAKGLAHKLAMFEGEGHGFHSPATVRAALEMELAFYRTVFKLPSYE